MQQLKPVAVTMGVGSERASVVPESGMDCGFQRLVDVPERGSRAVVRDSSVDTAACGGHRNTAGSLAGRAAYVRRMELSEALADNRDKRRVVACAALQE